MAWKVKYGYRQVPNFVVSCKDRDDEVLFSSEYFQITRKIEGCPWAPIGCGMGSVGAGLKPAPATRTHLQATPWAPHSRSRRADQASIPGPRGRANAFIASVNDTWLRRLTLECMPALAGRLLPQIAAQASVLALRARRALQKRDFSARNAQPSSPYQPPLIQMRSPYCRFSHSHFGRSFASHGPFACPAH